MEERPNNTSASGGGENQPIKRQTGFDPMTGEPVYELVMQNGYDTMTGQPIYQKVRQDGFDPMTGKPVYVPDTGEASQSQPFGAAVPDSVQPEKPKKKKGRIAVAAAAIVAVIAAVGGTAYAAVQNGFFLEKHEKVLKAAYKTFENDRLAGVLVDTYELMDSGALTAKMDVNVTADGQRVGGELTMLADASDFQYRMDGKISYSGISGDMSFYLDKDQVQLSIPVLSSSVYELNFSESDGYLAEALKESTDGQFAMSDVAAIMEECAELSRNSSKYRKEVVDAMKSSFKEMELEEISSKSFSIAGSSHKLKGYTLVVTDEDVIRMLEDLVDVVKDYQPQELNKMLEKFGGEEASTDAVYREMIDELKSEMPDFKEEVDIYLYKGQIGAIEWEAKNKEYGIELTMQGSGKNLFSAFDMDVYTNGEKAGTIYRESDYSGNVEEGVFGIKADGDKMEAEYSYDTRSGEYTLSAAGYQIKGTLLSSKNKTEFSTSFDAEENALKFDLGLTLEKGARISKLSGDVFDIGKASESELQSAYEEIEGAIKQFAPSMGLFNLGSGFGYDDYDYDDGYDDDDGDYDYDDYDDDDGDCDYDDYDDDDGDYDYDDYDDDDGDYDYDDYDYDDSDDGYDDEGDDDYGEAGYDDDDGSGWSMLR